MAREGKWLWYLQVALEGKEVIFAINAKGSFLLTMVNFSTWSYPIIITLHLIFYQPYPSLQGGMASRRRNSKMTYNFEVCTWKSRILELYVSKSKVYLDSMDLRVLGHFGNLVSRATTFMFWVFSNSKWNYVKKCHEVWKKYKILTLEIFSKC